MLGEETLFWLIIAAIGGLSALGIWYVFVRPVPRQSAAGEITQKTFKPASVYWQQMTGNRTNFWTPGRIPIAECYIFIIRLDDRPVEAIFSLNTTASERFEVGNRVSIDYEERGLGSIWRRVYVVDMNPS